MASPLGRIKLYLDYGLARGYKAAVLGHTDGGEDVVAGHHDGAQVGQVQLPTKAWNFEF